MNASQSKALIEVARKASEALLALDPDSVVALELWTAIHRASEPAKLAARPKLTPVRTKIPKVQYGPHVWRDGRCLDDDDTRTFANMVHAHFYTGGKATTLDGSTPSYDPHKAERDETRERLSYCACGGKAEDHREDNDGNLLECSHCNSCDHFHYQTDSAAAA
jgi:hypothetical protein